ncbi:MAG: DUF2087 domain-containing protein [[Clostridium] innocuum]
MCEFLEPHQVYSEEGNQCLLKQIFEDFVSLRRYLIEYGFCIGQRIVSSIQWI